MNFCWRGFSPKKRLPVFKTGLKGSQFTATRALVIIELWEYDKWCGHWWSLLVALFLMISCFVGPVPAWNQLPVMISLELLLLWVSLLLGAFLHPDAYCDTESVNQLASCDVLFYTILAGLRAAKNHDVEHPVAWTEKNQAPPTISWLVSACDAWAAAMSGGALGKHSAHGLCSSKDQRGGWPKLGYDPCMVYLPHMNAWFLW